MNTIELNNVNKIIKGVPILTDINYTFQTGPIYGLFGHNGSGKTMMLRMIAGLIKPTSGNVFVNNKQLHKDIDFPENVGVLIETPNFWSGYTGEEVLMTLANIKKIIGKDQIYNSLIRVGLQPNDKRTIKKYSLGMRQRLGIAQAIMEQPDIILLDEPTNALDKEGIERLHIIIEEERERGATVIIASHNPSDLMQCDIKLEMENGKIIQVES